MRIAIELMLA